MNISPVNNTSFGKIFLKDDSNTKSAVKTFVKDKDSLDSFNSSLISLDSASEGYDMELSAKKDKCAYVFYLNSEDDPKQSCSAGIPNSSMHTSHEQRAAFSEAMDRLIVACANLVDNMKSRVSDEEIDQLFNSRKKYK